MLFWVLLLVVEALLFAPVVTTTDNSFDAAVSNVNISLIIALVVSFVVSGALSVSAAFSAHVVSIDVV